MIVAALLSGAILAAGLPDPRPAVIHNIQKRPGAYIVLQDRQGHCPDGTRRFLWMRMEHTLFWVGCWTTDGSRVSGIDEEDNALDMGVDEFQWREGAKPKRS